MSPVLITKRAVDRRNVVPVAVFENLEAADVVLQQDRQCAGVGVVVDAEVRGTSRCSTLDDASGSLNGIVVETDEAGMIAAEVPGQEIGR